MGKTLTAAHIYPLALFINPPLPRPVSRQVQLRQTVPFPGLS